MSSGHRDSVERHHTPDVRVKYEDERKYRSEEKKTRPESSHHHRHHSNGHMTNGTPTSGEDELMKLLFREVKHSLEKIKSATKNNIPDSQPRANLLREHLRVVGNFIRKVLAEDDSLGAGMEARLW